MALINYDIEKNKLTFIKGGKFDLDKILQHEEVVICPEIENLIGLRNRANNEFQGISYNSFFSDEEVKGFKGEKLFNEFLVSKNIPALYVGQGINPIENADIINQQQAKRPDYLVTLPNLGSVFFDVKCRTKILNEKNGKKVFYLSNDDIEKLHNLKNALLVPVWIAFIDANDIDKSSPTFYICPISTIYNYFKNIKEALQHNNYPLGLVLIPEEFLHDFNNEVILINNKIETTIIEKYLHIHTERLEYIHSEVFQLLEETGFINKQIVANHFKNRQDKRGYYYKSFEYFDYVKNHVEIKSVILGDYATQKYLDTFY